jgi:hypothetical protein
MANSVIVHPGELTVQFLRKGSCCMRLGTNSVRMMYLLEDLDGLTRFQKITLINRYITITEEFQARSIAYSWLFTVGRFIVTVGSLIVPALLSIQYTTGTSGPEGIELEIYWTTWVLSLLVTTFNGILTLFKIDKKYYFLNTVLEQLQSEMWQYIHLTGRYSGKYIQGQQATHENQFVFFCNNMEKIKLKQVEEEYFKLIEAKEAHPPQGQQGQPGLYVPTPDQQKLLEHKQELAVALLQGQPTTQENLPNLIDEAVQERGQPPSAPTTVSVQQ